MGSMQDILGMIPGLGKKVKDVDVDEKQFDRMQAIILSMTPKERAKPDIINASRKKRIADGCGQSVEEVNALLNRYRQMQKLFRQMNGKGKRHRKMRLPNGFNPADFGM